MKYWKRIDNSLTQDVDFDDLRDELEDINDLLMYFQDIFDQKIPQLTKALSNSLLYYAYFPCLIGSIGTYKKEPEISSYSAVIFFLCQTYNYIKEPSFINTLSVAVFMPNIPQQFVKLVAGSTKIPLSYRETHIRRLVSTNLYNYAEGSLSVVSLLDKMM